MQSIKIGLNKDVNFFNYWGDIILTMDHGNLFVVHISIVDINSSLPRYVVLSRYSNCKQYYCSEIY